jgi:hypothetical protein
MSRNEEFENGRMSNEERAAIGAEHFKEALIRYRNFASKKAAMLDNHDHDYSDSKNNDTCSTCGAKNPNDSYDKGKD